MFKGELPIIINYSEEGLLVNRLNSSRLWPKFNELQEEG